ncbi:MAG: hypothetical protein B6D46_10070 [Polyangiaceae bacterium UTPRO1]|nr:MAG: hypothetical protein B6D46_10070 [Polyangiaceae bacterium UTPRO1]
MNRPGFIGGSDKTGAVQLITCSALYAKRLRPSSIFVIRLAAPEIGGQLDQLRQKLFAAFIALKVRRPESPCA